MALRSVPEHPKFADLKAQLGLTKFETLGLLEALWHFTGKFALRGNVGKFTDREIEAWLEWQGEPGKAIKALVSARWLDECPVHRLVTHDWHQHADGTTKKQLGRAKLDFVQTCPDSGQLCPDMSGTNGKVDGQAGAGPAPEPVAGPEPAHNGLPILRVPMGEVKFDHSMVAQGVLMELRLSGANLLRNVSEVAKAELANGGDGLALMGRMAESGRQYLKAKADGKFQFPPGLEKFYGEGLWRDKKLWPWKDGHGPPTEQRPVLAMDKLKRG